MRAILRKLAGAAYRLAPKRNDAVVWAWPDNEDSAIALERALQECSVRRVFLLTSEPEIAPVWETGAKTTVLRKNSVAGWLRFCFARHVFFTHPCYTRDFPENVVSVNVWHGMPIKRIGRLIEDDPVILSSHTLATSPFWAEIMRGALAPQGDVLPLGLPRNDRLFSDRAAVMGKLGLKGDVRLLAWLPTYRKSVRGLPRTDGADTGDVFGMPGLDPDELNAFLEKHNAVLLVKPHPMAAAGGMRDRGNIIIADAGWLRERSLSLYELLGATELLISDISSVVIDYLLLDRPVIHAFPDLAEYRDSRGFTVEPIEDYFAGPVVSNPAGLLDALHSVLAGGDPEAPRRKRLRELSHLHADSGSTRRLMRSIGLAE